MKSEIYSILKVGFALVVLALSWPVMPLGGPGEGRGPASVSSGEAESALNESQTGANSPRVPTTHKFGNADFITESLGCLASVKRALPKGAHGAIRVRAKLCGGQKVPLNTHGLIRRGKNTEPVAILVDPITHIVTSEYFSINEASTLELTLEGGKSAMQKIEIQFE